MAESREYAAKVGRDEQKCNGVIDAFTQNASSLEHELAEVCTVAQRIQADNERIRAENDIGLLELNRATATWVDEQSKRSTLGFEATNVVGLRRQVADQQMALDLAQADFAKRAYISDDPKDLLQDDRLAEADDTNPTLQDTLPQSENQLKVARRQNRTVASELAEMITKAL
jgi:hypothetical protein